MPGPRLLAIMVALSTESLATFPRPGRMDVRILLSGALMEVCGVSEKMMAVAPTVIYGTEGCRSSLYEMLWEFRAETRFPSLQWRWD